MNICLNDLIEIALKLTPELGRFREVGKMKTPILILNLKGYDEVLGEQALNYARIANKIAEKYQTVQILVAPHLPTFKQIAEVTSCIAQHIDSLEPGPYTGHIVPKEIKLLGGIGSLINHSEKRMPLEDIRKSIELCRKYGLVSFVCAQDNNEVRTIAKLNPDFIAIEPPELIGSDASVSKARPESITQAVIDLKNSNTQLLCGAGINTRKDVEKAIQLGAKGILVASAVVMADDVEGTLEELVKGMV